MKKAFSSHYINSIFVNMPFRMLDKYGSEVFQAGMYIEIGITSGDLDNTPVKNFEVLAEKLASRGILYTLHGPFWDLCPGSEDLLIRQVTYLRFQQLLDVAQAMNPVHIVLHTGYDPRHHRYQRRVWIDRAVECWMPIVERAKKMGFKIVFENVWEEDPGLHREIVEKLGDFNVGFCLDLGHQNCFSSAELAVWLEDLGDYLAELHIHDNNGVEDSHSPPGSGNINFGYLFSFLSRKKIYPLLNVEPHNEEDFVKTFENLSGIIPSEFLDEYRKALAKNRSRP